MDETLFFIKPEGYDKREEIRKDIIDNGFSIIKRKELHWKFDLVIKYLEENLKYPSKLANQLMPLYVSDAIFERYGRDPMVEAMIAHSKGDAIKKGIEITGPRDAMEYVKKEFEKTLRGKFGLGPEHSFIRTIEGRVYRFDFNAIHRSSTKEEFEKESKLYFS